jgi:hypothetical protein
MPINTSHHNFHANLIKYINTGCLSRRDLLLSAASLKLPYSLNAPRIIRQYRTLGFPTSDNAGRSAVDMEMYRGGNPHVLRMMEHLDKHLKDDLWGGYVHGSLGTYEETAFSDFDALAIIKSDVLESSERLAGAALKLNRALSIMFDFDPLQHHGWFVLTEEDLKSFLSPEFNGTDKGAVHLALRQHCKSH